ncbi:hypothetical protein [Aquamicrobium zhengzhouense]|uniref:Lipoprotein n=1 Tax=Aquamicrobium zhengzhouense TaxID=2781738 RepID=A0ABS0SGD0_9HYPH|nr:hypothetical protein [Aquamicrobium zhengzhouense]MBI1622365.1 hypothetical protein [Aquamicrobium zhengzhouense]
MKRPAIAFCATILAFGLTGCVRTSDGSIEPKYVPEVKSVGHVPVVALKPNRQDPQEIFPRRPASAPPPALVSAPERSVRRPPARRAVSVQPRTATVSCHQVEGVGVGRRVRMDCR